MRRADGDELAAGLKVTPQRLSSTAAELDAAHLQPPGGPGPDPTERRPEAGLETDLDTEAGPGPGASGRGAAKPGRRPGRWSAVALIAALLTLGAAVSMLLPNWQPQAPPVVVGGHLREPITLPLPEGVHSTSNGGYVALVLDGFSQTAARVLITAPSRVAEPQGGLSTLPDDPSRWLRRHPLVIITRVDHVLVDGRHSVQVDYRLVKTAPAAVPLFCGPGPAGGGCAAIGQDTRVRATFVPIEGRVLMVEAIWSRQAAGGEHLPGPLAVANRKLLTDLHFVAH